MDVLIKNGHVVDPKNGVDTITDLAIAHGQVVQIAPHIPPYQARSVIDATGLLVTPGLVDPHVHLVCPDSPPCSYAMLLRVGVTTTLDLSGPADAFIEEMRGFGCGLTAGCVHALRVGADVPHNNPDRATISEAIDKALAQGAFGIKMLGGHYPFTPEATAMVMDECHKRGVYVSIHAGTTATGSNIEGMEEAIALANGKPLHLAHVNAYCRGQKMPPTHEVQKAMDLLCANPHIVSEAYLSMLNGTSSAWDKQGQARSGVTRTCLTFGGYSTDRDGIEKAIHDGWCQIYTRVGDEVVHLDPKAGYDYWISRPDAYWAEAPAADCSFAVNNPAAMLTCLTTRRANGAFVVDAISTDGGVVPRNVIMRNGLALVRAGYLTLPQLIEKSTWRPAAMLGLHSKGHLAPGADADVALFNPLTGKAIHTLTQGVVRVAGGLCVNPGPGTLLAHPEHAKKLAAAGLNTLCPDLATSTFTLGH